VKLVVDMNLSPSWAARLTGLGFEAVHWSTIGVATAPDNEILAWATERTPRFERSFAPWRDRLHASISIWK
jgi:hypothetical protein